MLAPTVITSDTQNERYIGVLLEMERKRHLTSEQKYMELLTLLVETYKEKYFVIHAASPKDVLNELN